MDILLGPQDFEDFILLIIVNISVDVHGVRNMLLLFALHKNEEKCFWDLGICASSEDPMFTKKSFRDSAMSIFVNLSSFL